MKQMTIALLLVVAATVATSANAQTTTIEVPQGSGVFPTIGQVNCLEESGSGRYCAATYECSGGVSGELWGDLANHDGRRAIGATSPVANGRDCVITVDGSAAVRWLTGYRPGGRTGELVGLTTSADALRPVQRVERSAGGEGSPRLISWILDTYTDLTTLPQAVEKQCDHYRQGHEEHDQCLAYHALVAVELLELEDNAATRCLAEKNLESRRSLDSDSFLRFVFGLREGAHRLLGLRGILDGPTAYHQIECLDLVNETLREHGIEFYVPDGFHTFQVRLRD